MTRPKTLDGDRFISFRATLEDQNNIRTLMGAAAEYSIDVGKTQVIRDALGMAARTALKDQYEATIEMRSKLEAAEKALEEREAELAKAEKRIEKLTKKRTKAGNHVSNLLRYLPEVERRAKLGLDFECGVTPLDQLWLNSGKSWERVAERMREEA